MPVPIVFSATVFSYGKNNAKGTTALTFTNNGHTKIYMYKKTNILQCSYLNWMTFSVTFNQCSLLAKEYDWSSFVSNKHQFCLFSVKTQIISEIQDLRCCWTKENFFYCLCELPSFSFCLSHRQRAYDDAKLVSNTLIRHRRNDNMMKVLQYQRKSQRKKVRPTLQLNNGL